MARPTPKAFEPNAQRSKKSRKHEERLAKDYGGHRLPRSGGVAWSTWSPGTTLNGDVGTAAFHIEHKSTEKKSITIKQEWLEKVREGANATMKEPALIVTFVMNVKDIDEWVIVPRSLFDRLTGERK